jgi:4-methyl-5(b-hydroxyethyl)-thiazole monophosphate biosynthesis
MVYLFLAEGFETIEALTVVDMLRRAKIDITTVSITDSLDVKSSQGVPVKADEILSNVKDKEAEFLVLPGGMPGTTNLRANATLMDMVTKQNDAGKYVAAICAAPAVIFCELGITKGMNSTCYPSYNDKLEEEGVNLIKLPAVVDSNVITGMGMGTAIEFSYEIIKELRNKELADQILDSICFYK